MGTDDEAAVAEPRETGYGIATTRFHTCSAQAAAAACEARRPLYVLAAEQDATSVCTSSYSNKGIIPNSNSTALATTATTATRSYNEFRFL